MLEEIIISGFGGQGVMLAGQLLIRAGMEEGLEVSWIPSYGPEMRGGTANCSVVLSDEPIGSPVVSEPSAVLAMNLPSFEKYLPQTQKGGLFIYNSSLMDEAPGRGDLEMLGVPATEIADGLGSGRAANMVMLGALLARKPLVKPESIIAALAATLPAHRQNLLPLNEKALKAGAEFAEAR